MHTLDRDPGSPSGPKPAGTWGPELNVIETGEGGRATAVGSAFP